MTQGFGFKQLRLMTLVARSVIKHWGALAVFDVSSEANGPKYINVTMKLSGTIPAEDLLRILGIGADAVKATALSVKAIKEADSLEEHEEDGEEV